MKKKSDDTHYALDKDHNLIKVSVREWAEFFESGNRLVGKDMVKGYRISTVFLGIDHSFGMGPPVLFETMVFGIGDEEKLQRRWHTWQEAAENHEKIVKQFEKKCKAKRQRHIELDSAKKFQQELKSL